MSGLWRRHMREGTTCETKGCVCKTPLFDKSSSVAAAAVKVELSCGSTELSTREKGSQLWLCVIE